jgi:hypothetical protein
MRVPVAARQRTAALAAGALAAVLLCMPAPPARAAGFAAGAARIDITPPPASANAPPGFGNCPPGLSGARRFSFEELYLDLNPNGQWDPGEPFCDANANGRYDEIFTSGASIGSPRIATSVHDPIDARALAISDGSHTAVIVSVVAQGLYNTYIDRMITAAKGLAPIDFMIVSANHNESSPDTIGIYGGPSSPSLDPLPSLPAQTGVNDYYMSFLVDQVAKVAADAARSLRPATLSAVQFPLPPPLGVRLSDNWPTTDNSIRNPTAIDNRVGVLQARDGSGRTIFSMMSLAAHNQEIGHTGSSQFSSDWPGYFHSALEARVGGLAMFLVGDNGSQEDPCTVPPLCDPNPTPGYGKAQATGEGFAQTVASRVAQAQSLRTGGLRYVRKEFCVPLENNLFRAAAGAGLFGQRTTYVNAGGTCVPAGASGGGSVGVGPTVTGPPDSLFTTGSLLDVGPDLQLIANPGEAFPALMVGGPWRHADVPAECQGRANPAVPTWPGHGLFRFQVGLANDMIGYEIPAWAYIGSSGTFTTSEPGGPNDPACQSGTTSDPTSSTDSAGHHHKLETEGVGPTASNAVANQIAALVNADAPDPSARIRRGRYVLASGGYSNFPAGAVGVLLADQGASALDPAGGTLIGAPATGGFGARAVDANGFFVDYNGQPQAQPDVATRGMVVFDPRGCVSARYYLDEFPDLGTSRALGARISEPAVQPGQACSSQAAGVPGVQVGAAQLAGLPAPGGSTAGACRTRVPPHSITRQRSVVLRRGRRLRLTGSAGAQACGAQGGKLARVTVTIRRASGKRCRFVRPNGRLSGRRKCGAGIRLLARGTSRWSFGLRLRVPRGSYTVEFLAIDRTGLVERTRRGGLNVVRLRVR